MSDTTTFHLYFWGQINNDGLATRLLGTEERDFWFDTSQARDDFERRLRKLAESNNVIVAINKTNSSTRTVAHMVFEYGGQRWPLEYDFGIGYEEAAARYMFEDGNYSCDCNRRTFLERAHPGFVWAHADECADRIQMVSFSVEFQEAKQAKVARAEAIELEASLVSTPAPRSSGGRL